MRFDPKNRNNLTACNNAVQSSVTIFGFAESISPNRKKADNPT